MSKTPNEQLLYWARMGSVDGCNAAKQAGAEAFDAMLEIGAERGNMQVCDKAIEWGGGQHNCLAMADGAAKGGRPEMYKAAMDRGFDFHDLALETGAKHGRLEICQLAKDSGATRFDRMLTVAALHGRKRECEKAIEWGATDLEIVEMCSGKFPQLRDVHIPKK